MRGPSSLLLSYFTTPKSYLQPKGGSVSLQIHGKTTSKAPLPVGVEGGRERICLHTPSIQSLSRLEARSKQKTVYLRCTWEARGWLWQQNKNTFTTLYRTFAANKVTSRPFYLVRNNPRPNRSSIYLLCCIHGKRLTDLSPKTSKQSFTVVNRLFLQGPPMRMDYLKLPVSVSALR